MLSEKHPPKILPTIYPIADLPCHFIRHFANKIVMLRDNIASARVTSTPVTGTTTSNFPSFEKVKRSTDKDTFLLQLHIDVTMIPTLPNS